LRDLDSDVISLLLHEIYRLRYVLVHDGSGGRICGSMLSVRNFVHLP
jgi:hypothetical protein